MRTFKHAFSGWPRRKKETKTRPSPPRRASSDPSALTSAYTDTVVDYAGRGSTASAYSDGPWSNVSEDNEGACAGGGDGSGGGGGGGGGGSGGSTGQTRTVSEERSNSPSGGTNNLLVRSPTTDANAGVNASSKPTTGGTTAGVEVVTVSVNGREVPERMVWEPTVSGKCRWANGSVRLDHKGLVNLKLEPGPNHVKFRANPPATSTAAQGGGGGGRGGGSGGGKSVKRGGRSLSRSVHSAECCIFLWRYDDRVVQFKQTPPHQPHYIRQTVPHQPIPTHTNPNPRPLQPTTNNIHQLTPQVVCDVDGTITKSDVIGFIGTIRGGKAVHEHTHPGVCSFMHGLNESLGIKVCNTVKQKYAKQPK